jgi:glycosyltransferase involved in cell wall biosynthesis
MVIAGKFDPARFLGKGQELPSTVRLLGRVSDANLFVLMRDAFCFLFPSRVEGFGLPALEAMAADCPLIVSISPCLPEICGPAAITVDPDDVQGWINAIAALAADPERRQQLIEAGRVRRGQFSWTRIAHHYAQLMRRLDYPVSLGADTAAGTERQLG